METKGQEKKDKKLDFNPQMSLHEKVKDKFFRPNTQEDGSACDGRQTPGPPPGPCPKNTRSIE